MIKIINKISEKNRKKQIYAVIFTVIIVYSNFIALQASSHVARRILATKPLYVCLNVLLLFAVYCFIAAISRKLHMTGMIFSTVCTVWALINDYVYALHGQIFTFSEIKNAFTAWNVMGDFTLLKRVPLIFGSVILIIYGFNMAICILQKKSGEADICRPYLYAIAGAGVLLLLSFPAKNLQKVILKDWTARNTCIEEGYPMYVYASIFVDAVKIMKPEGYSEEKISDYAAYADENTEKIIPDIILILNEAFYDLSLLTDLQTDIPFLDHYYGLDNAIRGYTVTSVIGGATNKSEFELLTGNTNYLLGGLTPFNVLDMSCTGSIVTNLKDCGYYTLAAHPADGGNYNRIKSYAAMGFDQRYFKEDFQNYEYYGKREWMTDRSAYNNLTAWYEKAVLSHDHVFAYLLTMQNHSGYDSNGSEDALVHVQSYTGNSEKELNEYLSCVYLSDLAFKELTEYFSEQERPVILCMAGDHAPNIVREVADVDSSPEREIMARATPFIIWANYDIDGRDEGIISVNGLAPLLLETAGVEMMPYYRYIRDMQAKVPVVGSFGSVMDTDGRIYSYDDDMEWSEMIWQYLYLSYNNLQKESIQGWFHPAKCIEN